MTFTQFPHKLSEASLVFTLRAARKTGTVSNAPPEGRRKCFSAWRRAAVPFALLCACTLQAQSLLSELKAEQNPQKRSEKALSFADAAFENAHEYYLNGQIQKGEAQLDDMTKALSQCVESLHEAHKGRYYKKAEMNVANLQRRLDGLLSDLSLQNRGWAEYTSRKLDEIHDKLLKGVMSK